MGKKSYCRGDGKKQNIIFPKANLDELHISHHSRAMPAGRQEGGNPCAHNVLKRMDSRLRTSGMTGIGRIFYEVVNLVSEVPVIKILLGF
jgi:hypothetical protein